MLEVGSRVKCKSFLFSGAGRVVYIDYTLIHAPHLYPIQVELDEPDQDGHKIKRFNFEEVEVIEE